MDLTTFDVTEIPGVIPGTWLELIGPHQTPDDLAAAAGTNAYEVLTSLSDGASTGSISRREPDTGQPRRRWPRCHRRLPRHRLAGDVRRDRPVAFVPARHCYGRAVRARAAGDRLFQPARRRVDRSVHRHGAGAAIPTPATARFSAEGAVANVVVLSITRELGPVLAGLMVAGRIGAAMAAEIGTMRVTDQIDALSTLSTNPMKYLVTPRLLAGIMALPMLVVVADILGACSAASSCPR